MNYTLHQLQVFTKVVQLKSVTRASEELHMTQPAVSIQLKNFQDQFDIPLTQVIGRQLYVTDFGKEIFQMAERILNEVYAINYKTMAYKGHLSGKLSVSSVSTGKYVMPYFLSAFLKQHPGIDLSMDVTNKQKVIHSLKFNEVDFALVSLMPANMNLEQEELLDNALFVIGNKSFKLFGKHRVKKEELSKLEIIYREEGSGTRTIVEEFFNKNQLPVRQKLELTSNEAVKQAVIAGLGCSIMPLIGIRNELKTGELKIIPAVGFPILSKWRLVWLKGKKLSPIAEAFLSSVRKDKEMILKSNFNWIHDYV